MASSPGTEPNWKSETRCVGADGPRVGMRREQKVQRNGSREGGLTPFMIGISEAGSVDIDASSRNTTGKSMTRSAADADVIHVVHTYNRCQES